MMSGTPTFEEQVNTVVSKMTTDEKGNSVLPEDVEASPEVLYAAKLEKRHRDTQSAFTKAQQRAKALEEENAKLASSWEADAVSNLSATEQARLEELKTQDPDAWRAEITVLEESKKTKFAEKRQSISKEAQQAVELQNRQALLDQYNSEHPETQLTDEVIENDIPPRITKQLEKGEITFEEFVAKCDKFLNKPKKIATEGEVDEEPTFARSGGGSKPSESAVTAQDTNDYKTEIF